MPRKRAAAAWKGPDWLEVYSLEPKNNMAAHGLFIMVTRARKQKKCGRQICESQLQCMCQAYPRTGTKNTTGSINQAAPHWMQLRAPT